MPSGIGSSASRSAVASSSLQRSRAVSAASSDEQVGRQRLEAADVDDLDAGLLRPLAGAVDHPRARRGSRRSGPCSGSRLRCRPRSPARRGACRGRPCRARPASGRPSPPARRRPRRRPAIVSGAVTPSSPRTRPIFPGSRPAAAHLKSLVFGPLREMGATPRPVMPVAPKTTTERSRAIYGYRGAGGGGLASPRPWLPAAAAPVAWSTCGRLAGIGDAGEDEVVVVGGGGVEVDVADLHDPLVDDLPVVDVLDALEAGLLDLAGDDSAFDVEAPVGDRVGGRDPLDEADQDGEGDDHEDDQEDGRAAHADQLGDRADDRGDHDPFQVEAEDRAPGGVALEDHLLAGAEVEAGHRRAAYPSGVRASSIPWPVSIAKVEPLTTARALRGPFDYRLPAEMEGLEVGSIVRVPFGHRRVLGVVVERAETLRAAARAPRRADRGARGRALPPTWSGSASGSPASTARRPRAGSSWCCRRAPAPAASGFAPGSSCGLRSPPPGRRR